MNQEIIPGRHYRYGQGIRRVAGMRNAYRGQCVVWQRLLKDNTYGSPQETLLEKFQRDSILVEESEMP